MPAEFATLHGPETETGISSRTVNFNISSRTEQREERRKEVVTCKWTMWIPHLIPFLSFLLILNNIINLKELRKECDQQSKTFQQL